MKTILVPVDLSSATTQVCTAAQSLARQVGGKLVILYVMQPPLMPLNEYQVVNSGEVAAAINAGEKFAVRKLAALGRSLRRRRLSVRTVHAVGQPVALIQAHAEDLKPDYLVIGSHGHGAIYDLFAGSTTQGVLKRVRCPVLVVPIAPSTRRKK